MKKIINKNRVRLVFPKYDLAIEPNEIKTISNEQFVGVINNISIEEAPKVNERVNTEKDNKKENKVFIDNKGRTK